MRAGQLVLKSVTIRDEITESIHAMRKAGIQQVAIQAISDPKETIETFAKEIIRRMR